MSDLPDHVADPELFPDWPMYKVEGLEADDLVEVANNPDFSDATEAWFWSATVDQTYDVIAEEGEPTQHVNWEHFPVYHSYVRREHGGYGAFQTHRYIRKLTPADPPEISVYEYDFDYKNTGLEVVWNPYTNNSRYMGVDPDDEWPKIDSPFSVEELVEVSDNEDFADSTKGLFWASIIDLDYDVEVDEWNVARRTNWRQTPFHFTLHPETREPQRHRFIREYNTNIVKGECNMRGELDVEAQPEDVTKQELYGLLTRLENMLENETDPALMLRTLSSFVNDAEDMLPRVLKLREMLNNTDV